MEDTTNLDTGVADATTQDDILETDTEIVGDDLEIEQPITDPDHPDYDPDAVASVEEAEEEVEYEGKQYKLPKELKEALLRNADYTRKTQEVAEHRRAVEAERENHHRQVAFQQEFFAECAEAFNLDKQIKQYRALDLNALYQTDPDQARQLDWNIRQLEERRDQVVAGISQKSNERALQTQQETARRGQEAAAFLEREIKGWAPGGELDRALESYAKSYDVQNIGPALVGNPKLALILHKAYQFDQLTAKQAAKPKPPTQAKPVTRISATKGTAAKDPSQMSDTEFAAWRKSHIKRRSA